SRVRVRVSSGSAFCTSRRRSGLRSRHFPSRHVPVSSAISLERRLFHMWNRNLTADPAWGLHGPTHIYVGADQAVSPGTAFLSHPTALFRSLALFVRTLMRATEPPIAGPRPECRQETEDQKRESNPCHEVSETHVERRGLVVDQRDCGDERFPGPLARALDDATRRIDDRADACVRRPH